MVKKLLCIMLCVLSVASFVGCREKSGEESNQIVIEWVTVEKDKGDTVDKGDTADKGDIAEKTETDTDKEAESPPKQKNELITRALDKKQDFAIVDHQGKKQITNKDVIGVYIVYKKGQNRYLEIRFSEKGAKQFKEAVENSPTATLSIMLNNEILTSNVIANEENPERAKLTGDYDTIMNWFNKMT